MQHPLAEAFPVLPERPFLTNTAAAHEIATELGAANEHVTRRIRRAEGYATTSGRSAR
jgi:hypothetical protein